MLWLGLEVNLLFVFELLFSGVGFVVKETWCRRSEMGG